MKASGFVADIPRGVNYATSLRGSHRALRTVSARTDRFRVQSDFRGRVVADALASCERVKRMSRPRRTGHLVLSVAAVAIAVAAIASRAPAQLNMNDLLDEGKDLIIQQSLGSFGSSLGSQVPVLIDHKSAYPTVRYLSGKAFAPKSAPAVANALRASRDGTAMLPPGDYAFPVDVFCMRANAESPNGYQYHIAPLHGSAADIITVLNARAPSYGIAHGVLQVLEWNIQGGVPYAGMAAPERAAVDKVIPEFRSRFNGTSYADLAKQYATLARSIPGMPALEQALQRIGPIGNAMSNINTLQHQLAAHPQEFDQLSRVLVPLGAAAGSTTQSTAASRATPWSRYSIRCTRAS